MNIWYVNGTFSGVFLKLLANVKWSFIFAKNNGKKSKIFGND